MAYVSNDYRFVFFAAPATGSSAVIKALEDRGIGEFWPKEDIVANGKRVTPVKHSTLAQLKAGGIYEPIASHLKVVGVRNVFAWLVAKYLRNKTSRMKNIEDKGSWIYTKLTPYERDQYIEKLRQQSKMTFEEFLKDTLDRHNEIDIHEAFHADMDMFIHQEAMDTDFAAFRDRVGLPSDITVPKFNVTGAMEEGKTYQDFYTPETTDYVYKKCRPFFARFPEYSFEGLDADAASRRASAG